MVEDGRSGARWEEPEAMNALSVFIADDSQATREKLRGFLSRSPELRVVGEAADGLATVEGIERLRPDVLLLDLSVPGLGGFELLERLSRSHPVPTVILTSRASRAEVHKAFEALRAGAVDVLPKPEDPVSWPQLSDDLPRLLRAAAAAQRRDAPRPSSPERSSESTTAPASAPGVSWDWLALGASTGGPAALHDLLSELPKPPPLRVVIVQHIARGLEPNLADWLGDSLRLDARVAFDGERLEAGDVRLAPADAHFRIGADGCVALDAETPKRNGHRPSVDELFQSLADFAPLKTAAALLTGMGTDGADGMLALRRAGGFCLAQDEASSAVFGMPSAAFDRGGAEVVLAPREIGRELARRMAENA
jgi:two-component system chemotaxis response regulator CheB